MTVKRLAHEDYAAMEERLVDAMGDDFENRMNPPLVEHGLIGDADASESSESK